MGDDIPQELKDQILAQNVQAKLKEAQNKKPDLGNIDEAYLRQQIKNMENKNKQEGKDEL